MLYKSIHDCDLFCITFPTNNYYQGVDDNKSQFCISQRLLNSAYIKLFLIY